MVCQLILARCCWERDIQLWGHHLFYIPPMYKLNPVYEEFMGLRFRYRFWAGSARTDTSFPQE
ncbi:MULTISPECIES: Mo-dependent nitrogenase C-terminal domain-containing protein [unclassified Microcoleus]|uniref:Mo-dependent nitrogenase C-terminal domain-containing protein n=1 Tax=unclassified Microcoleus TaxID=2642155 RepID=UPI002FCFA18F